MQLATPFFLLLIVTFLRLESARSSSSTHRAAWQAWANGPAAPTYYITCSPRLIEWPLCLGESLLPWNSNDKKCCLYEAPYVAAPVREIGEIITRTPPCAWLPTNAPTRTRKYFGSQVTCFWKDLSRHMNTLCTLSTRKSTNQQKQYQERTTLHAWGVPWRVL